MKSQLKKFVKVLLTLILCITTFVPSLNNVKAASQKVTLGPLEVIPRYIAGVSIDIKKTTSGLYVYCVDNSKPAAKSTTATLVGKAKVGVTAIMNNGYPNKSLTGDKSKDYYITQAAVWWYLDNVTGSSNLGTYFKQDGSDPENLRPYIKNLVQIGENAKENEISTSIKLSANSTKMTLKNGYYISDSIKATTSNINDYTVSLKGAPAEAEVINSNNQATTKLAANESFYVRIPANKVTSTEIKVTVTATGKGIYKNAYVYCPDNGEQDIAILEDETVSATLDLELSTSKVTIVKVDAQTDKAIAGAKLVLKDSSGRTITSWTSTINGHVIRNLEDGTYIIEELEAPKGYKLDKTPVTFTIDSNNKDIKVKFLNEAKSVIINITKVDASTGNPLAGATLVVKDSTGNIVARFTSTTESYILKDLEYGTYTVEEESAPAGYKTSTDKISFTIDDEHLSHQIMFENYPEIDVPNTASNSMFLSLLGIAIIGIGIRFVYKNKENA